MKQHLLAEKGNFYKACLHVHTTCSDGLGTPEEIKKMYMEKGYSIVAYTDHEVIVPHNDLRKRANFRWCIEIFASDFQTFHR